MKTLFIVNPVAGKGKAKALIPLIQEKMKKKGINYTIKETQKPREATWLAKEALEQGYEKVVAVGGDGTISEVINGLAHTDMVFGIIAAGTGNDVCRTLNIPFQPDKALEMIFSEEAHPMDLGKINEYYFINVASMGIDAEIAYWVKNSKKWFSGTWAYIVSVIKNLWTYRFQEMRIAFDRTYLEGEYLLLAIGNGKYYGGGMKITPHAKVDDGLFDVCIIEKIAKWKVGLLFPVILKGNHVYFKEVKSYQTNRICINKTSTHIINVDGEIYKTQATPICFSVHPEALRVIYPKIHQC